jgi:hypothetical protein
MLARQPASSSLDVDVETTSLEIAKLLDLLTSNRDVDRKDFPLLHLLRLDPRHPLYHANLLALLEQVTTEYPQSRLKDNIEVFVARSEPSPSRRISALSQCVETLARDANSDVLPWARYELGMAYQGDKRPDDARQAFEAVRRLHPGSPWSADASRRLAAMPPGRM